LRNNWFPIEVSLLICFFCIIEHSVAEDELNSEKKKSFSLFNVVQFDNDECTTNINDNTFGTCFTTTECTDKGGVAAGNCASGFGVCCFIKVDQTSCGATINNNITYIENTVFPTATTEANIDCTYSIQGNTNVCQIRLDFVTVVLGAPDAATAGSIGQCTGDSLTVTSPSGNALTPLCGTLSQTHMYVETARQQPGSTVQIQTSAATNINRSWKIKTISLECETAFKAPTDCLQYLTGVSNSFTSFNFGNLMIRNLQYDVCIRPERGYCRFQLQESSSVIASFVLDPVGAPAAAVVGARATPGTDDSCDTQFITVDSYTTLIAGASAGSTRFCGNRLNLINGNTASGVLIGDGPRMKVGVFSSNTVEATAGAVTATGFDLMYTQIPCN
jgi:hypothetical protein